MAPHDPPREVGWNRQHAIHAAVPEIAERRTLIAVVDQIEHTVAGRDRVGELPYPDGWNAVILVDDRDPQVLHVAAERIPEHDELHDREDHRDDNQHGAAPEPPHFPFD